MNILEISLVKYSNLAYALIGNCLVEHFYSDLTYDQYVQKFILAPLGMTQTGFTYTSRYIGTGKPPHAWSCEPDTG